MYFGYDLGGDGYGGSPLCLDDFPVISFGERAPVLPVGSMVRIATGSEPLYAEIVYKEGAHPETGTLGDVPGWVSGAPVGAEGPGKPCNAAEPRRRELLVPDFHAFGPALSLSPAQLHRLRTRRRWINGDGHVVVNTCYPSGSTVGCDDLAAYADHLVTTARAQLLSPFVAVSLAELVGGTDQEVLRAGLLGLLDTVRGALISSDLLRTWGHYAVTCASLADGWCDTGPLGGDDLRSLVSAVERAAVPARRRRYGLSSPRTVYTAVGPRLRAFPGATESLRGVGYAAAVCRANLALAGAVHSNGGKGACGNGSQITLDDAFEGGGVWRSHHPGDADSIGDPLTPAGRGWAATICAEPEPEPEPEPDEEVAPVDLPLADEATLGRSELLRSDAEEIVWRSPLRLAHLIDHLFPLHSAVARELRNENGHRAALRLQLIHTGTELDEYAAKQDVIAELSDDTGELINVTWPRDFFPGLILELHWPRGSSVIRMATTRLRQPMLVGDRAIGHCFDPRVLTREDAPGSDHHGDTATGLGPRQLVMRTVRRCGLLTLDGHALLDRSVLPNAAYGRRPARSQATALETAVAQLLADRVLVPDVGSRDTWGQPHFPARDGEPTIPLIGYRPALPRVIRPWGSADQGGTGLRGLQFVPGHLRRLLSGCSPSEAQRLAFREHCRRLGKADGWELPEGYTFVTEHIRGR
ncbi:hypothetical protein ACIRU5_21125 [Streptomyces misionensis]|uniref:hypothetical protein n=1 Tax=Streptomyces misionensis TaxID=67331 RepID=UPI00382C2094